MITLYDIPSTIPGQAWSPNTWKARYSLNFKGVPYQTAWIEYPDIEATCKKIGALPTTKRPDGTLLYTLPMIHDPSTGAVIAESSLIAEYLDKTYPDAPRLFPDGTKSLQHSFLATHRSALAGLWQLIMPATPNILNPPSRVYFKETKFGPNLKDVILSGKERDEQFLRLKEGFDVLEELLRKEEGPFVMGDAITFVDLAMAGYVLWMKKIWGEESMEWTEVKGWHMGRWATLLTNLERYESIL